MPAQQRNERMQTRNGSLGLPGWWSWPRALFEEAPYEQMRRLVYRVIAQVIMQPTDMTWYGFVMQFSWQASCHELVSTHNVNISRL